MNRLLIRMSPDATTMIRLDHTHVLATFHKYRVDLPAERKRVLADTICLALEIHAKLEEEIFYPAMRSIDPDIVDKSVPEHNEMRRLISRLRVTPPHGMAHDAALMALMRDVMRHVADEETMLLPEAERALGDELRDLGARMMRRRLELAMPRAGELARNGLRAMPGSLLAVAGALVIGAFFAGRALTRPSLPRLAAARLPGRLAPSRLRARLTS